MTKKLKNIKWLSLIPLLFSCMVGCSKKNSENSSNNQSPATGAEYYMNQKVEDDYGQFLIVETCTINDNNYGVNCCVKFFEYNLMLVKCHSDLGEKERESLLEMKLDFEKTGSINGIDPYEKFAFDGDFVFVFTPNHTPIIGEKLYIDFAIKEHNVGFAYFVIEVGE